MKDLSLNNPKTMSSREIAELTGKQHKHVRRDIAKMLTDLGYAPDGLVHLWTDPQNNQQYEEYRIDRRLTECLLTGYSAKARIKVIDRWHELEEQAPSFPAIPQTYAEALQLAADQAKQLELQAPKVAFVENLVERNTLMTATQVAQKHGLSAIKLNRILDELGGIYSKSVKRSRVFCQSWVDKGYGQMKQTETGHDQALFTPAGEVRIHELMISEGVL